MPKLKSSRLPEWIETKNTIRYWNCQIHKSASEDFNAIRRIKFLKMKFNGINRINHVFQNKYCKY